MEIIILVGHGSPKKDANRMETVGRMLHPLIYGDTRGGMVKTAYLQFEKPDLTEAIREAAWERPDKIIVHPFFLSSGVHVTKDIPAIVREAESSYPDIEFVYTEPLGISGEIINVIRERIEAANGRVRPDGIEALSFEKIERENDLGYVPEEARPIVRRVIHATADFDFKKNLFFHSDAVRAGLRAIRSGKDILADVEMVRAGINKELLSKFGGKVVCRLGEVARADGSSRTRAERAIEAALNEENNIGIVAIGNAPTALISCVDAIVTGSARPGLVVGVPVGFVRAVESKALLAAQGFPFITALGRKGGSPVAAAIVNALLKIAEEVDRS